MAACKQVNSSRGSGLIVSLLVSILVLSAGNGVHGFFLEWGKDLEGPWCATRPGEDCCEGRDDYCAVPILGTECYCDIFCNATAHDCCPDYWRHCHGYHVPATTPRPTTLPPPRPTRDNLAPCIREGVAFRPGDTIRDNCNNCTCELYTVPYQRYEFRCTQNICLLRPELIEAVNDDPRYFWSASNYSNLWGLSLDEGIRYRLGSFQLSDNVVDMTPIRVEDDVLPEAFDARDKWPNILHPITDQGNCASSWAHSTAAVATDRLGIETEGIIKDRLSVQHLLSCDIDGQLGCNGGHLDRAWWFLRQRGVVSDECYPYTSGKTRVQGTCLITGSQGQEQCPSGIQYKTEKRYQATPPYRIRPLEREIMKEIMDNGPVQATMQVREDFFMYSRGVYKYTGLTSLRRDSDDHMKSGFHSVRIVGWGAERSQEGDIVKYWICANSWGTDWGENGYFRILRGSDESSIESYVIGVWGKITGDPALRVLLSDTRRRRLRTERARKRRHLRQLRIREERRRRRKRRHHTEDADRVSENKNPAVRKHKLGDTHKQFQYHKEFKHQGERKPGKVNHKHNKNNGNAEHNKQHIIGHNLHKHKHDSSYEHTKKAHTNSIKDKIIYDLSESMYV
ncbi:hypothetical protein BsWGS_02445 [Bradybaena similaris]